MPAPFLQMTGISKSYPGVRALSGVSLSVAPGEVIGLVGENGAGKSTLMKILGGVVAPSEGTILLDGQSLARLTVDGSMGSGIAFVHQELNLFDNLTVAANIFIGREPLRGGLLRLVDEPALLRQAAPLLAELGADFGADRPVASLSVAERQLVEIAKALSLNARLVIMDEPTSSLTAVEAERLLGLIRVLAGRGVAIILISHRLHEIEHAADRVVVLRDGMLVAELSGGEIRAEVMIRHMIGRDLKTLYTPPAAPPGAVLLETREIRTPYRPDARVSLSLHAGEILGLAGLIGAGRTELARVLFGIDRPEGGEIAVGGQVVEIREPADAIKRGIYLIPEDRKRSGLVLAFAIGENIVLPDLWPHAAAGLVDTGSMARLAGRLMSQLSIRAPNPETFAGALSGGNQQKVVLAKWLAMAPRVLIFDEPTRGVDVGAKSEIYRMMRELADRGVGILMISSDMEEVIGVSDRVAVMHEGRISGFLGREALSEQSILSLAVGHDAPVDGKG